MPMENGNLGHRVDNGRPRTSEVTVEQVRVIFESQLRVSVGAAFSHTTVPRILRRCLFEYPYKVQNFHGLRSSEKVKRLQSVQHCQNHPTRYSEYLSKIVFFDECTFRLNGSVSKQNVRIWGTERPTEGNQSFLNSPSVMVWCDIAKEKVVGPYFLEDESLSGGLHFFARMVRRRIILLNSERV